jgi:predicted RNA-binding Zn-ribbon protein involved in translation (DUF1610 family)
VVRIRAYTFTLSLPILIVVVGFAISLVTHEIGGVDSFYIGFGSGVFGILLQLIFSIAFACPECGKSPYTIGPLRVFHGMAAKPIPDRVCSNCGYNLAAREDAA